MPESTTLAPNASTTMKVIARFQNETAVTGNINGETQTIEVKINTEQDDGNGGMDITPAKFTGTIYRWNNNQVYNNVNIKGYVYANSSGSMGPSDSFNTEEACLTKYPDQGTYYCQSAENVLGSYTEDASTLNKTYYLKHVVVDDIITASYVCFVTDEEHCIQGGVSSFYSENIGILQTQESWFTSHSGSCDLNSSSSPSYCQGGGFDYASALSDGSVSVGVGGSSCPIGPTGNSYCR